ncbi:ubiquitin carboxyl-terminal hydrolase 18-like [Chlorella sorokiniana]|uniref:Ubiquitin carboxyl-terminal hydrolase 18-like n=1 Tax=Chlorella sorokiniana TaxID=3076 RepID=A0A2P6TNC9_CHLSO|nr:ubiquitin carboxyl-terminal hydrolase 18-like [Chlorella sorokiniana]|eukprot:PRW50838.1 ubiquitin carboxyl-terminal hydrolase 18-like [Chlorella sorokiniana]
MAARDNWKAVLIASRAACSWLEEGSVAADMADALDSLGCWPGCTPTQLRCAAGVLRLFAANQVAGQTAVESEQRRKGAEEAAEAVEVVRLLIALDPESARYRYLLSAAFQDYDSDAQMGALRDALDLAECTKCHYHAALCCYELAHCTVDAKPGHYSIEEVEALLQRGDDQFKCVKAWCSANMRATAKFEATYPRSSVAQRRQVAAMLGPLGASVLGPQPNICCVVAQPSARGAPLPDSRCSGCGRRSGEVKRCGRCKTAVYCSVECQRSHWAAGHKHECAQLAAKQGQGQ